MSMYFLDETDDWPEYEIVKAEIQRLDQEHLELHKALREAECALQSDPANQDLKAGVDALREKLKETAKKLDESLSMYR